MTTFKVRRKFGIKGFSGPKSLINEKDLKMIGGMLKHVLEENKKEGEE